LIAQARLSSQTHIEKQSAKSCWLKAFQRGMIAHLKANFTKMPRSMVREDAMAQQGPPRVDPFQVARIVASYLRHHQVGPDQLAGLIVEVHRALAGLGRAPPVQERLTPAVARLCG
jgi:hypothetical protein